MLCQALWPGRLDASRTPCMAPPTRLLNARPTATARRPPTPSPAPRLTDARASWKVIAGTLSDMDWPETEYYWGTYGSNVDNVTGHAADDVLEYDLPQLGLKAGEYTNADFLNMSSPLYDTMPYVYAHFKWDHCAELGYAIGNKTALQVAAGDEQYVAPPGDSSAVAGVTLARR